jgi:hypothetical protein
VENLSNKFGLEFEAAMRLKFATEADRDFFLLAGELGDDRVMGDVSGDTSDCIADENPVFNGREFSDNGGEDIVFPRPRRSDGIESKSGMAVAVVVVMVEGLRDEVVVLLLTGSSCPRLLLLFEPLMEL